MKMSEMTCHRADTAWMRSNFGISVHWVSQSVLQDGTNLPYEEAVNRFDPEKFADTLAAAGAEHHQQEGDVVEHAHHLAGLAAETLERKGPVVLRAAASGILRHVVNDAAGDDHRYQRRDYAGRAVLHIVGRAEGARGKAGAEMPAKSYRGNAQYRCALFPHIFPLFFCF